MYKYFNGASGIGMGLMLTKTFGLDTARVSIIERGNQVGHSFQMWPKEMRFISPSFNQQGWTASFDLNSVAFGTSPAFTLGTEHPTGDQYAKYLNALADAADLRIKTNTEVTHIKPLEGGGGLDGEFQYPKTKAIFPGSVEHCRHNSSVQSWSQLQGDNFVVVGGYESGMDAAYNLSRCGKACAVIASTSFWNVVTDDPSSELAPHTADRIRTVLNSKTPPRLFAPFKVVAVEKELNGSYLVRARKLPAPKTRNEEMGQHRIPMPNVQQSDISTVVENKNASEITLQTVHKPLLCVGFEGSVSMGVVQSLFNWNVANVNDGNDTNDNDHNTTSESGSATKRTKRVVESETLSSDALNTSSESKFPSLTEHDESTKTPGLFLAGPAVQHENLSFCFVYKFRQRFGIVSERIASQLGFDTSEAVQVCRDSDMF